MRRCFATQPTSPGGARKRHKMLVYPEFLTGLFLRTPWRLSVLQSVRQLGLADWAVGAGFVRSAVWDHLHGYSEPSPLNDVDVLYFDPTSADIGRDEALERELRSAMPDVPWQVKNQVRMHHRNGDPPYRNCEDALRYWLETATCVALRLEADDTLAIMAPYGLDDLLALRSRPTPRGRERYGAYIRRMRRKNWPEQWPRVRVEGL